MAPEEDQYPDLTQPLTFDKQAKLKLGEPHSQPASPLEIRQSTIKYAMYFADLLGQMTCRPSV